MATKTQLIDTHFHVWDLGRQELPWLAGTDGSISRTYTVGDYLAAYDARDDVDLIGGVYVEVDAASCELEDSIVAEFGNPRVLALMLRSQLSPSMRVPLMATGVREPLHIDSEPRGRCLEPGFIEGLRLLASWGMPFESCNRVGELDDLYEALCQVPEATVILNHLGNVETLSDEYKASMRRLAKLPNLYVKVSGYPTANRDFVHELLGFVRDTFSPFRLLYASNWPVVDMYSSLDEHLSILLDEFAGDEDFFVNNAARAYGIEL